MTAVYVPNGKQDFGTALSLGSVAHYVPGTLTPKFTWTDETQSVANPIIIPLDAYGRCTIWGQGLYRQILKDQNGVTIWDVVTGFISGGGSPPSTMGVAIQDQVGNIASSGTVQFNSSPSVSFGLTGSTMTASVNTNYGGTGFSSTTTAGNAITGTMGTNGLSLAVPPFLTTTPAQTAFQFSNLNGVSFGTNGSTVTATVGTNYAGPGFSSTTTAGTAVAATHNSAGLSMAVPAFLTTTPVQTAFQFSNSNGVSFGTNGSTITATVGTNYAGTGLTTTTTAGTAVVGTQGTNGLSLGIPAFVTAAGGAGVSFSGGTSSGALNSLVFSNSGGVSFGLSGSTLTGIVATNYAGQGLTTTSTAGAAIVGTNSTNGLSLGVPNFLTTAMQIGQSSNFAGTGFTSTTATGSAVGATLNTSGLSMALPAFLTTTPAQTAFILSNSNGVSFGTNGSTITASVGTNYAGTGLTTTTTSGVAVVGTNSTNGLSLAVPAFLTTAMQSGQSSNFNATGFTTTTAAGAVVAGTNDTAGLKLAVPAFITTAMQSNASTSLGATGLTTTTTAGTAVVGTNNSAGLSLAIPAFLTTSPGATAFVLSNSNGVSFGTNASTVTASIATTYAGTGFTSTTAAGAVIGGTHNTAGLLLGVPAFLTTAMQSAASSTLGATGLTTTTTSGVNVVGTNNTAGLSLAVPAFLTTAMASNASSTLGATGLTTTTTAGTAVVGTNNTAGLSLGFPAYLTTAALSGATSGFAGNGFTTTTTGGTAIVGTLNTAGLSLNFPAALTTAMLSNASSAFAGTGFTSASTSGLAIVGTHNTAGLSLGVPNFAPASTVSFWEPNAPASTAYSSFGQNTLYFQPLIPRENVVMSNFSMLVSLNAASTTVSATKNETFSYGLYSQGTGANSTQWSLAGSSSLVWLASQSSSGTIAYTLSQGTNSFTTSSASTQPLSQFSGQKVMQLPFSTTLNAGNNYAFVFANSTAGGANMSSCFMVSFLVNSALSNASFGQVSPATIALSSATIVPPGNGYIYTATSGAFPATYGTNQQSIVSNIRPYLLLGT